MANEDPLIQRTADCISWCRQNGLLPVIIHSPEALSSKIFDSVPSDAIAGMVSGMGKTSLSLPSSPAKTRAVAIISPRTHGKFFNFHMARQYRKAGVSCLVRETSHGWEKTRLSHFLIRRFLEKILWMTVGRVFGRIPCTSLRLGKGCLALCAPHAPLYQPEQDGILMFNASLGEGGAERQLVNTLAGLRDLGHQNLHVLCEHLRFPPGSAFYLHQLEEKGIPATEIDRTYSREEKQALQSLLGIFGDAFRNIPEELAEPIVTYALEIIRRKPQVVHAWQDMTSVFAGFAAIIAGTPRILLCGRSLAPYNYPTSPRWLRACYRILAQHPAVIMANNSRAGAKDYEKWLGLPEGRIGVLSNGFDGALFRKPSPDSIRAFKDSLGIPEGHAVIGTVARMSEEKDPFLFWETAKQLLAHHENLTVLHVGSGPLYASLRKKVEESGHSSRYLMPGNMKDPVPAFSAMDVFLLTSRIEGTPNVILEAQALGIPVVSTNVGGAAETFADGKTGFLVHTRKAEDLARKTSFILEHPEWAGIASHTAPDFIKNRFGLDAMLRKTLDFYKMAAS
ncbi:MAG TPA: hypothetical protein DCW68_05570 [Rhodospirillaceae bacterium]|nr:MAG: hypothetical protein A2018_02085 [Alphaproteobacteria bacterium GWF2_58_20]HAU29564.1 hypothetical protein [Rhodospirillaceae bacterium]